MSSYTIGGADLLRKRPETIVGEKDDAAVYIPVEARIRLLLRCPARIAKPGIDVDPAEFEPHLREAAANSMLGIIAGGSGLSDGFLVEVVCVQEFEPGGAGR